MKSFCSTSSLQKNSDTDYIFGEVVERFRRFSSGKICSYFNEKSNSIEYFFIFDYNHNSKLFDPFHCCFCCWKSYDEMANKKLAFAHLILIEHNLQILSLVEWICWLCLFCAWFLSIKWRKKTIIKITHPEQHNIYLILASINYWYITILIEIERITPEIFLFRRGNILI